MLRSGLGATDGGTGELSSSGLGMLTAPPSEDAELGMRLSAAVVSTPTPTIEVRQPHDAGPTAGTEIQSHRTVARRRWMRSYQAGLVLIDFAAACVAVGTAFLIWFVIPNNSADTALYAGVGALLPLAWVAIVAFNRAYEGRYVGVGPAEFERVFRAFLHLIALVAIASYATKTEIARGFVVVALPLAVLLDLGGRYAARKWLHRQRRRGRAMTSVLAVGEASAIASFTDLVERDEYAGMRIVGACLPTAVASESESALSLTERSVVVWGDVDSVLGSVYSSGADTVAVVSSGEISPERLRWISWQLEGTETDLVVSPGLMEVAGPRLHIQPVAGLPLLHVEKPEFRGFRRFFKEAFDRVAALTAIVVLLPVFLGLWLAVRLTSRGSGLFRQTRVGRDGSRFTMVKFRSMYVDAEDRLAELQDLNLNGDGLLFKLRSDPRVTRVGRVLRKLSLDELPQLINVVTGKMSLVGPRPPLPSEVDQYRDDVRRRLLVKPGVTGLWQVSGRSDLSWEESVRLDLRYIENWSLATDLVILWKTIFTVAARRGAY